MYVNHSFFSAAVTNGMSIAGNKFEGFKCNATNAIEFKLGKNFIDDSAHFKASEVRFVEWIWAFA